ncbi:MAG: outer membrane protein assembly factor [Ruminococcus flavefaciens]|nr:outer membrane protein assembly factor [Ruminococcus flavefaciens]
MKNILIRVIVATAAATVLLATQEAAARTIAAGTATAVGQTDAGTDSVTADTVKVKKRRGFWRQLFHGNEDHTFDKKMDVSFIAAPSYTREASFGIGGIASGLYRLDKTDSLMQPSDISIAGNVALSGLYMISVSGNNYFKGNRSRLSYDVTFANKPLHLWGIDYASCAANPAIDYTRSKISIDVQYVYKLVDGLMIGVRADFSHAKVKKIDDESYLQGQKRSYTFTGLGVSLQYDTRDFIPNPQRGIYVMADVTAYPQFMSNYDRTPVRTTFIFDFYHKLWESGIIATDIYGRFNGKDSPWVLREELGGGYRMRGYYAGRYIDNNIVSCQAELRQRIYKRIGCTFWGGCGTVFPQFSRFEWKNILPSYGLGLRWEFKHRVNIRVDYGFGKQTSGFIFNINEAF